MFILYHIASGVCQNATAFAEGEKVDGEIRAVKLQIPE